VAFWGRLRSVPRRPRSWCPSDLLQPLGRSPLPDPGDVPLRSSRHSLSSSARKPSWPFSRLPPRPGSEIAADGSKGLTLPLTEPSFSLVWTGSASEFGTGITRGVGGIRSDWVHCSAIGFGAASMILFLPPQGTRSTVGSIADADWDFRGPGRPRLFSFTWLCRYFIPGSAAVARLDDEAPEGCLLRPGRNVRGRALAAGI